jgi:NagD protein
MRDPNENSLEGREDSLDRLARLRHVVLDMDGTIYLGRRMFPWTGEFLECLGELKVGYTFVTNNNSRGVAEYVARLRELGADVGPEGIYTSTMATVEYLKEEHPRVQRLFVLGTESLRGELETAGFEETRSSPRDEPDAVVVGFDTSLGYERLSVAAFWIGQGKPFIATHPDRVCPTDEQIVLPDCGSICACLNHATGRSPVAVLGKPDPRMVAGALRGTGVPPADAAVVGDRLYTDMKMARASGALAVLVLSGETRREQVAAEPDSVDLVVEHLGQLGELLRRTRG